MAYGQADRRAQGARRDQLVQAVEDVRRSCEHGIESVLVTDEGLLEVLGELKRAEELPQSLILKAPIMLGAANPVSVRNLERLGLTTFNVDGSQPGSACRAPRDDYAARYLHRGPRRRRVHPSLRDRRDRACHRAGLSQVRFAQRAEHLSQRYPPRGHSRLPHQRAIAPGEARTRSARIVSIRTRSCRHYRSRLSPAPNGRRKALRYADRRLRRPRDLGG